MTTRSEIRVNLSCPNFDKLYRDQFRKTRKCLESFYLQQPNQPQINNVTEGEKEGEVMHVYEDY